MIDKVTVVMIGHGNVDLADVALRELGRRYPGIRVLFAESDPNARVPFLAQRYYDESPSEGKPRIDYWKCSTMTGEERRDVMMYAVKTPFALTMDTDCKIIRPGALEMLLEELDDSVAITGAYCSKVVNDTVDGKSVNAYCSTVFTERMDCDMVSGYFALHRMSAFRAIGGFPLNEPYYRGGPEIGEQERHYTNGGADNTICRHYQKAGYRVVTPKSRVPLIHWGRSSALKIENRPFQKWWDENVVHRHIEPLNDWQKFESGERTDFAMYRG